MLVAAVHMATVGVKDSVNVLSVIAYTYNLFQRKHLRRS